jgi:hypothetical protein
MHMPCQNSAKWAAYFGSHHFFFYLEFAAQGKWITFNGTRGQALPEMLIEKGGIF